MYSLFFPFSFISTTLISRMNKKTFSTVWLVLSSVMRMWKSSSSWSSVGILIQTFSEWVERKPTLCFWIRKWKMLNKMEGTPLVYSRHPTLAPTENVICFCITQHPAEMYLMTVELTVCCVASVYFCKTFPYICCRRAEVFEGDIHACPRPSHLSSQTFGWHTAHSDRVRNANKKWRENNNITIWMTHIVVLCTQQT